MPRTPEVVSHWHHSVEKLSTSALEYYGSIEMALKAEKGDVQMERLVWNESGIFSAKREYLRIGYGKYVFDVSAFPFGNDFYFSWWLGVKRPNLLLLAAAVLFGTPIVFAGLVAIAGFVAAIFFTMLALGGAALFLVNEMPEYIEALAAIPYAGPVFRAIFAPTTYHSEDTRIMFEETVDRVVQDVVAGVLAVNGMSPLTPEERAPRRRKAEL